MNLLLNSDFKTVAAEIVYLVFPKTQFQVLFQEIGTGNVAITFKNPKDFSDNFKIQFYSQLRKLIISAYSTQGIVYLNYLPKNKYEWLNKGGFTIKPPCIGDKFEFLAGKFYLLLHEFFLGKNFVEFSILTEFETVVTKVAEQTFPRFNFRLNYSKNREKALCFNFIGDRNLESKTVKVKPEIFAQKESIYFNVNFRSHGKCLAMHTRWDGEQYLLVYKSSGDLSWSSLQSHSINTPSAFGKEFETIAIQLYPILQEFFLE